MNRRDLLKSGLGCSLALAGAVAGAGARAQTQAQGQAQGYPDRLVRIVVPFAPGGATDVVARALAARLTPLWQQQVVVENRPGAGGNIGADLVAKASPDGYTLLLASPAEIAINQHLYAKMPYDPARDLLPVSKVASAPLLLVVNSQSPVKTVAELVAFAKSSPRGATYASSGTGGPQHLAAELFRLMAKAPMTHVPYKGGAPATADLLGGQVDLFFSGLPPALPHVRSGRLRPLGVTTAARTPLLKDVPTIAEQGFAGFNIENWQGLLAPAGTPPAIVAKIAASLATVAADPSLVEQLSAQGAVPDILAPEAFAAFIRAESTKYAELVKASGARAD